MDKRKKYVTDLIYIADFERYIYTGEVIDDVPNGEGILKSPSNFVYEGSFKNGKLNGKGKVTYPDGSYSYGFFIDSVLHGKGTEVAFNGDIYKGNFKDGSLCGYGTVKYANGDLYKGNLFNNIPNGQGKKIYKNGVVERGIWKNGDIIKRVISVSKIINTELIFNSNREKCKAHYEGEMVDDKPHGRGRIKYINGYEEYNIGRVDKYSFKYYGDSYEGEFIDGQPAGRGTFKRILPKEMYKGEIYNGFPNGDGKYYKDGKIFKGNWCGGKLNGHGKITSLKEGLILYEGDFYNNDACSVRKIYSKYGDVLEGHFIDGKLEGEGKFTLRDGSVIEGVFEKGIPNRYCSITSESKYNYYCDEDGNFKVKFKNNDFISGKYFTFVHMNYKNKLYAGKAEYGFKPLWGQSSYERYENRTDFLNESPFNYIKRNGIGLGNFNDRYIYIGNWRNDKIDGLGKVLSYTGDIYYCYFSDDIPNKKWIKKIDYNGNVYEGSMHYLKDLKYLDDYSKNHINYKCGAECYSKLTTNADRKIKFEEINQSPLYLDEQNDKVENYFKYILTENNYKVYEILKYTGKSEEYSSYFYETHGSHASHGEVREKISDEITSKVVEINLILDYDFIRNENTFNEIQSYIEDSAAGPINTSSCLYGLEKLYSKDYNIDIFEKLLLTDLYTNELVIPRVEKINNVKNGFKEMILKVISKNKILYKNKDSYKGKVLNNVKEGNGIYRWHDGNVYEGEFRNDDLHGQGRLELNNGIIYEGDFTFSSAMGIGKIEYVDGTMYQGSVLNNKRHGLGKMIYNNDYIFEGEFLNGLKSNGTLIHEGKVLYEGDWIMGLPKTYVLDIVNSKL